MNDDFSLPIWSIYYAPIYNKKIKISEIFWKKFYVPKLIITIFGNLKTGILSYLITWTSNLMSDLG